MLLCARSLDLRLRLIVAVACVGVAGPLAATVAPATSSAVPVTEEGGAQESTVDAAETTSAARTPVRPPTPCYAPGTAPEVVAHHAQRRTFKRALTSLQPQTPSRDSYEDGNRWTGTATTPSGLGQGDPTVLTWSIVPDGTPIFGYLDEPTSNSNLHAFLDGIYGSQEVWMPLFESVFDRWAELTGLSYVYVSDDGAPMEEDSLPPGVLGSRGDVRIGGHFIDGNGNILAYNFFPGPSGGDMVIDTGDVFYSENSAGSSLGLRNVLSHEHGHGLGLPHVCPVQQTKLMEPFVSFSFDGPQHDDIRAMNRAYGDVVEENDTPGTGTTLGTGSLHVRSNLSIDDRTDVDYHPFDVSVGAMATLTVTPLGSTFLSGPQNADGSCTPGTNLDTLAVHNLSIEILDQNGFTVIASADFNPPGSGETVSDVLLTNGAGRYTAVVRGDTTTAAQLYDLRLTIEQAPTFDLTVQKSGTGSGSVVSSPSGINCGGACTGEFGEGTSVGLQPLASGGSTFTGFSGHPDCVDGNVTMTTDIVCDAEFTATGPQESLTVSVSGSGSVFSSPSGIACPPTCSANFAQGTVVDLSSSPASGQQFNGWTGSADCSDGSVTMNAARVCTATFGPAEEGTARLFLTFSGTGAGAVRIEPSNDVCSSTCGRNFAEGSQHTLVPLPQSGSTFVGFSGDAGCSSGTVTLNADRDCVARFDLTMTPTHRVQMAIYGEGRVHSDPVGLDCTETCAHDYPAGELVEFFAEPAPGQELKALFGDLDCADGSVIVDEDLNCGAYFGPADFSLFETGFEVGNTSEWSGVQP